MPREWVELSISTPAEFVEPLAEIFRRASGQQVVIEEQGGFNPDEGENFFYFGAHDVDFNKRTELDVKDLDCKEANQKIDSLAVNHIFFEVNQLKPLLNHTTRQLVKATLLGIQLPLP